MKKLFERLGKGMVGFGMIPLLGGLIVWCARLYQPLIENAGMIAILGFVCCLVGGMIGALAEDKTLATAEE